MKPILEHLAAVVFLVMIAGYMIAAEIKQRRLEQYIENQRNKKKKEDEWKKKCCRRCANLMIHVHAPDGQTVKFCGFICEKTRKSVKLDDIKACYEKPIGIK